MITLAVLNPNVHALPRLTLLHSEYLAIPYRTHHPSSRSKIQLAYSITGRQWYMIATHHADQDIMAAHKFHSRHSCKISNLSLHEMRTSPRYNLILTHAITVTQGCR